MGRFRRKRSPWLDIPAADYEGHMSLEWVGQLQALNRLFEEIMVTFEPRRLAVLGCATGNGFEHIDPEVTEAVVAVDINPSYLDVLTDRYGAQLPGLRVVCGDALKANIEPDSLDHVHAGLFFEYVEPKPMLERIVTWLTPGGVLSVALQLPSDRSGPVTDTPYETLELLEPAMRLVDPGALGAAAAGAGLSERKSFDVELKQGKKLRVIYYVRTHA
ncbi:MAG: class I SAM-dependent methyltransferase [Candidatus Latescibacterota bacterium]|jgi:ubiquinone/menaquinone biosynthesis C-methylase UbiE